MVRIVQLLAATALLSIFSYLLIFTSLSRSGNGGEYWGFDGHTEPGTVSEESFSAGDYRFLTVEMKEPGASTQILTPSANECLDWSSARSVQTHRAVVEKEPSDRTPHIAWRFADRYNDRMRELLLNHWNFECEQPTD